MIIRNLSKFMMEGVKRNNLGSPYPFGGPKRLSVPTQFWNWDVNYPQYKPPIFTIPGIEKGDKPWADPKIGTVGFNPKFNSVDNGLNRGSYEGQIKITADGYPLNPIGRTGLGGRGSLGKWGPNHAADCIVTRWKTNENGDILHGDGDKLPIVQFVVIRRQDSGEIAIPGGMVEPHEEPLDAAKREFVEEVVGIDDMNDLEATLKEDLNKIFEQHTIIAQCYVDDRRNTDNAWIETTAVNFHISQSLGIFHKMKFKSGSDAKEAFWTDYQHNMKLYASHGDLMQNAVNTLYEKYQTMNQ